MFLCAGSLPKTYSQLIGFQGENEAKKSTKTYGYFGEKSSLQNSYGFAWQIDCYQGLFDEIETRYSAKRAVMLPNELKKGEEQSDHRRT